MKKLNRRDFVRTTTAAGVAAAAIPKPLFGQAPTVMTPKSVKPVVIASSNGNQFKNGGAQTCVEKAFSMITGGSDVLDALIAGVNIVELDPLDDSVGYGGLPNADGIVQLDSCCMHGPKKRAGGVAGHRRRAHAVEGGAAGDGHDRPSSARRQGRAGLRARHGDHDRGRSQHRELARQVARVEAPHRPAALPRRRRSAQRAYHDVAMQMIAEGIDRPRALLRHHQLRRHQPEGRDLRRDDDERPGLEDSGPRRRFADPRRRALRGRRGRRRRLDRARRSQPLQPVVVPDRRGDAPRRASEGRRASRRCAASRRTRSRSGCSTRRASPISA